MDRTGGCSPLMVTFSDLTSGVSANASYSWDFGNGNSSTIKNPSAIYTNEKTYTVTLTVTDGAQTSSISKTITVYKKPVADFSVATPKVCLPQGASFTSNSTSGDGFITNYQWDFGDGTTQPGYNNQVNHVYSNPQTPTVSLTVTNNYGCQASITKPNVTEILPRIDPVFSSNKTLLCSLDDSIQLTNTSTGPGTLLYSWNFGDGTNSFQQNPSHQFSNKGVYSVSLTVSNTVGCSATGYPLSVNAAYFNTNFSNQLLCRQANFSSSSYLYPSSSLWQFGDGSSANAFTNTSHTYGTAGNYTVTLINTYTACKDTVTKIIAVQDIVNYNSGISMPASACKGSSVSFSATSSVIPGSMNWSFGDGSSYSNTIFNTISHVYSQSGTYTVTLVNTFGTCSETVSKSIVINDLPDPKGFIADFGGVCGSPVTVTFKDTTAGAVAWLWQMDSPYSTGFSTQKNAPYNFPMDGYHTVYLTVTNASGCTKTIWKQINIARPNASIYYTYTSSPAGNYDCDSITMKLAVNSNQPVQSYSWNFGNGINSTVASPQVSFNQQGIYPVTLNYITESGCPGSAAYSVRVYKKPKADFTYFVPCGNSLNLLFHDASFFSDRWNWSFGDGGMDYWSDPYHVYNDTGKYMVRFISQIGHCSDTIVKQVYANILPFSVAIIKADNTCEGTRGTVTFDQRSVRASGGTWNFGDGSSIPYDSSVHVVKHTYSATGNYKVTLTSNYGTCVLTSTRNVTILLKQNPVLSANLTQLCASSSLNVQIKNMEINPFTGNGLWGQYSINKFEYNNGVAYSGYLSNYLWQYNTYSSTLQNLSAGVTSMRAIINDNNTGCQDTSNYISLQVNGPIAGFKIQNNNSCFKSSFIFIDTSKSSTNTPLSTWRWDFGDGTTQVNNSGVQVTHDYINPGNYFVRLTVTDATGCNTTATATVNARGTKASFTTSGLFVPNVPLNTTVNFYNNSYTSNSSANYTWQYGDGSTSGNYTGSHTYTQPGVNTVLLIASDSSIPCSDTARQVITVKDFNTAFSFTSSFLGSNSCPPVLVRINNLSVGFTRLLWDFGDGTTTSSQYYPSHTYYNPGVYKITLYTYGYNGLNGTYFDSIEVKKSVAQLSADVLQGCISQTVNLRASAQNANTYLWDFGDGNVTAGDTASVHSYLSPGIYNPRLIAKDANGCAISTQLADTIVIDSLSIAIKGIPSLVCDSALIQFTPDVKSYAAAKLGTPLVYKWDFGTGNVADTANIRNPAFRYTVPGSYVVSFRVTSPYGCTKQTTATVVVNQSAHGTITGLAETCQDVPVQFMGAANPAANVQWNWNLGNGNSSAQQNPVAQLYAVAGNYAVPLVVTKNGCADTSVHLLTVHPRPVVNAMPQQYVLCFADSVLLSASGGGSYLWTPASGLSNSTIANPKASPQITTQYKVRVTTNKGCVDSGYVSIRVAQPINIRVTGATDICKGLSLQLNASGAIAYQWINNTTGLNATSISNPVAAPLTNTIYTVVGYDADNCFKDTATISIAVHDLPTVNAGPDVQIQGNIPYQLSASVSNDVTSWLWLPGNTLSCTTCAAPIATPKMETEYIVKVSNNWGCTASDTILIKLQCAISNIRIPDAFTPNNDGLNDVFYIKGSGVKIIKYLRIYDRWGGLIFEKTNFGIDDRSSGWDGNAKGQAAPAGTYVYVTELQCSSGELFTLKGTITVVR